jgi:hypothetical protein
MGSQLFPAYYLTGLLQQHGENLKGLFLKSYLGPVTA